MSDPAASSAEADENEESKPYARAACAYRQQVRAHTDGGGGGHSAGSPLHFCETPRASPN